MPICMSERTNDLRIPTRVVKGRRKKNSLSTCERRVFSSYRGNHGCLFLQSARYVTRVAVTSFPSTQARQCSVQHQRPALGRECGNICVRRKRETACEHTQNAVFPPPWSQTQIAILVADAFVVTIAVTHSPWRVTRGHGQVTCHAGTCCHEWCIYRCGDINYLLFTGAVQLAGHILSSLRL